MREEEKLKAYLKDELARRIADGSDASSSENVPKDLIAKAKALKKSPAGRCPHCGKNADAPLKKPSALRHVWLAAALVAFGMSFAFPGHFFQFLVLVAFFGFKWVVDARAAKTQILILKSLQENDPARRDDLQRTRTPL